MTRYLLLALVTLQLSACQADAPQSLTDEPTLLQTYAVPPESAEEISDSIGYLLGRPDNPLGRVTVLGVNRIAVAAQPAIQGGISKLIDAASEAVATEPPRIRFEYWLVDALPASGFETAAELGAISDALAELTPSIGTMRYTRADYVRHTLRSGAEANVGGRLLSGSVEAMARGDRIVGEFHLQAPGGKRLGTRVDLVQGETLVLAVVGGAIGATDEGFGIFVVRAETF